jgi:hypothetical protein
MATTLVGIHHNGVIQLPEPPPDLPEGKVRLTILDDREVPQPRGYLTPGKYNTGRMSTEEDFKLAEWHGEEEFDDE